jgi:hypothetical protein
VAAKISLHPLFCIFRRLHLRNGRPGDANFNLRVRGNFQNYGVAVKAIDSAINAATGDDSVTRFDGGQHFLHFLALPLLGHDDHEIHDREHQSQRDQETGEARRWGCLEKRSQNHDDL